MSDVHSKAVRSYNMSRIRGQNTKPEMTLRKLLHAKGFRYRLHAKNLPGKPDIILHKFNTVIFVHGCFWHSHKECRFATIPKSNTDYWIPKLSLNVLKDKSHIEQLHQLGWRVLVIWECELKTDKLKRTLEKTIKFITKVRK